MRAEIKPSGVLKITSETELEAYALRMWGEANEALLPPSILMNHMFVVDCSNLTADEVKELNNE